MTIYRILLDEKVIIPIDIGTHDRVYWVWMELDEFLERGKFKMRPRFTVRRFRRSLPVLNFSIECRRST